MFEALSLNEGARIPFTSKYKNSVLENLCCSGGFLTFPAFEAKRNEFWKA